MFFELSQILLREILGILKVNPGIFQATAEVKGKVFGSLPRTIADYLIEVSEQNFMNDLALFVQFLISPQTARPQQSKITSRICDYFLLEFVDVLDHLDRQFFMKSSRERRDAVARMIAKPDSQFSSAVIEILSVSSLQEINSALGNFMESATGVSMFIVQSPLEMESESKKNIRKSLQGAEAGAFVEFSISSQLLGGLRVFRKGALIDRSWVGKLERLRSMQLAELE